MSARPEGFTGGIRLGEPPRSSPTDLTVGPQPHPAIEFPEGQQVAECPRPSTARSDAMDGLRGLAIAMVLWLHFVQQYLPPGRGSWLGWLRAGTGLAWVGVDLFFVISGFFIGGILIDRRESPRLVRVFYLRRAARILPLYYVTLAAIGLAILGHVSGSFHLFPSWIYGLFLTNFAFGVARRWDWLPLSVLWTLAVEEQFYVTAPWIVRAIARPLIPWLVGSLIALAELSRACVLVAWPQARFAVHVLTPFRMDALAFGVLAAWAVRSEAAAAFIDRLAVHWRTWLALGISLLGGLNLLQPEQGSLVLLLFGYLLIATVFAMMVVIVAKVRPAGLNRILEVGPLVNLGRHSYFVYLWHGLVGAVLIRWLGGPDFTLNSFTGAGIVALVLGVTWSAAVVSWKWFEGPIVAWSHRKSY